LLEVLDRHDPAGLAAFRDAFLGEIILPGDADYDRVRKVWNGAVDRRPSIIARCNGTEDVIAAIRYAREHQLLVAVRGGGHSYPGFSTCDRGIVIDVSRMRAVHVDPLRRTARVEGGALLGNLDQAAQEFGLACPVGVVGHTGVGGLTLGGGLGRLQRKHGLTIDNLLAVDLATADGALLHVSSEQNGDLFWGIRGAGANFGIVVSFEFALHPVGPLITQGTVAYPLDRSRDLGQLFREFMLKAPDEITASMGFGIASPGQPFPDALAGKPYVFIGATHSGALAAAEQDLKPLRALKNPIFDTFGPKSYLNVQTMLDEIMVWGRRYYTKSGYLATLTDKALDVCAQLIADSPGDCTITIQSLGGMIARVPEEAMAFSGRDAAFWLSVLATWNDQADDSRFLEWGRGAMSTLNQFTTAGAYVNEVMESGRDVTEAIYGKAKVDRLTKLKRTHDPDNLFRLNQNILPE